MIEEYPQSGMPQPRRVRVLADSLDHAIEQLARESSPGRWGADLTTVEVQYDPIGGVTKWFHFKIAYGE